MKFFQISMYYLLSFFVRVLNYSVGSLLLLYYHLIYRILVASAILDIDCLCYWTLVASAIGSWCWLPPLYGTLIAAALWKTLIVIALWDLNRFHYHMETCSILLYVILIAFIKAPYIRTLRGSDNHLSLFLELVSVTLYYIGS